MSARSADVRVPIVALLLLTLVGCGSSDVAPSRPRVDLTSAACPDLLVVGVRGQQQDPDLNGGLGQEVRLVATRLTRRIQAEADRSVRIEAIDYVSDPPADLDAYDVAVSAGAETLDDRLDAIEATCGDDTTIAVIGFSMGAQVVHTALHDRSDDAVGLVAMIADPQRDPAAPYDVDAFGQVAPRTGSLGAGPEIGDLADRAVAFCAGEDDVCNHTPGTSRTAVDLVHKHFYEKPDHVAAMAREMHEILQPAGF